MTEPNAQQPEDRLVADWAFGSAPELTRYITEDTGPDQLVALVRADVLMCGC